MREGDVLFSLVRPYLRNIAVVPADLDGQVASTAFSVLRPNGAVASRFLLHQVLQVSFVDSVPTFGNSPPSAREEDFLSQRIVVAPVREQHRIVAGIEVLFAKLDEAIAALRRTQANLGRYRASVLKAAVEGRLTARWRSENPPRGIWRAVARANPGRAEEAVGGGPTRRVRGEGQKAAEGLEVEVQGAGRAGCERIAGVAGRVVLGHGGSGGPGGLVASPRTRPGPRYRRSTLISGSPMSTRMS